MSFDVKEGDVVIVSGGAQEIRGVVTSVMKRGVKIWDGVYFRPEGQADNVKPYWAPATLVRLAEKQGS